MALAALLWALSACSSPLGGRDLDLTLSARGVPGVGAGVALAQRMVDSGSRRIDFELGLEEETLEEPGPSGDAWTRAWAGLRCAAREPGDAFLYGAGITWLRSQGRSSYFEPGDYGGAYACGGYAFELTPALATGPDLTFMWVDSEGTENGSGALFQLAWRLTWHL
ncbi:MAG: hypothetical protein EXS08_06045 [Planctomycetes bacterium]|nr:hypothetical protein [Planctomycetota bacterium]